MAEAIGIAGSVIGIAGFGFKLATTLQSYVASSREAADRLADVMFEIESTATALDQLHDLIKQDTVAISPLFKDKGLEEIQRVVAKTESIYYKICGVLGDKLGFTVSEGYGNETEPTTPMLDNTLLETPTLGLRQSLRWPWLEPSILKLREELRTVKFSLLLQIQLATVAQFQMEQSKTVTQPLGDEEKKLLIQAHELLQQQRKHANRLRQLEIENPADPEIASQRGQGDPPVSSFGESTRCDTRALNPPSMPGSSSWLVQSTSEQNNIDERAPFNANNKGKMNESNTTDSESLFTQLHAIEIESSYLKGDRDHPVSRHQGQYKLSTKQYEKPEWLRRLLLRFHMAPNSKQEELAAFLLEIPAMNGDQPQSVVKKIPMEEKEVKGALAKLRISQFLRLLPSLYQQYLELDSMVRKEVDRAVANVKQQDSRPKTLVAIRTTENENQVILVELFFRIGEEVEPVYVTTVDGLKVLPFHRCLTWEMTHEALIEDLANSPNLEAALRSRDYIVLMEDRTRVHSNKWRSIIRPGIKLQLHMSRHENATSILPMLRKSSRHSRIGDQYDRIKRTPFARRVKKIRSPLEQNASTAEDEKIHSKISSLSAVNEEDKYESLKGTPSDLSNSTEDDIGKLLELWTNAPRPFTEIASESWSLPSSPRGTDIAGDELVVDSKN